MFNSLEFRCLISSAKVDKKGMRIYSGGLFLPIPMFIRETLFFFETGLRTILLNNYVQV